MSAQDNPTTPRRHSLASDVRLVKRHWRLVALIMVVTLLVFAAVHVHSGKSYAATASVSFQNSTLSQAGLDIAPGGSSEPQREADTEVYIAHSAEVADAVRAVVPGAHGMTTEQLLSQVKVEAAPTADVLNIIATTGDPTLSSELANGFADQYIAFQAKAQLTGIETAQHSLEAQIAKLPPGPRREALDTTLARIDSLRAVAGGGANVISRATPPTSPTSSGWSETIVIGLLVGFAIAFTAVLLRETFNRRVRSIEDLEAAYDTAALAAVPAAGHRPLPPVESAQLEPYRMLRSALEFAARSRELECVLITSAVGGEGKSTVAANLARALALGGRRTVLAELDLRHPAPIGDFQLDARPGLTDVLAGAATLEDVLIRPEPDLDELYLLPAGSRVANPSETLRSAELGRLLAELKREGCTVILDSAPLNTVADTQGLLAEREIDGVVLVAYLDRTTREEVEHARAILQHRGIEPLGLAVTHVRDAAAYGYDTRPSARSRAATPPIRAERPPAPAEDLRPAASGQGVGSGQPD